MKPTPPQETRPTTPPLIENPARISYAGNVTLLRQRDHDRRQRRLQLHREVQRRLKAALTELVPGHLVYVFGSLTAPGRFNDRSDIDIAFEDELPTLNSWQLTAELMERLKRPVDVVILRNCRFAEKIRREGERWTL